MDQTSLGNNISRLAPEKEMCLHNTETNKQMGFALCLVFSMSVVFYLSDVQKRCKTISWNRQILQRLYQYVFETWYYCNSYFVLMFMFMHRFWCKVSWVLGEIYTKGGSLDPTDGSCSKFCRGEQSISTDNVNLCRIVNHSKCSNSHALSLFCSLRTTICPMRMRNHLQHHHSACEYHT